MAVQATSTYLNVGLGITNRLFPERAHSAASCKQDPDFGLYIAEPLIQENPTSARPVRYAEHLSKVRRIEKLSNGARPPVLGWAQTARGRAFEQKKVGMLIPLLAKAA